MLGISDPGVWVAYVLVILSGLVCAAYGIYNWNSGAEKESIEVKEEIEWETAQKEIAETL